ncbi:HAS-barrel domain-containing protein [Cyanobacterium sp. uoEpiScrs1]|uniref:HAS-barrel domain-containing protein n=1 Tax=Cyanobacterium sp. uoEpiScrs1 TaxID=2976343 RepID=UPI00226AA79C|nr:HAS-barrel domain-containing protein [Cyanobacterium sp. uoEpiScrs1]
MRLPLLRSATDNRQPDHIAEVIETSTTQFLAQCLEPDELNFPVMPAFGSWVKSLDEKSGNKILGIVTYATTLPIDSVHRARALGLSLTDLREQQPQIFAMLKTEFRAAIVGFETPEHEVNSSGKTSVKIHQYLPPRPPQIHQGVYLCQPAEIINFSNKIDFLRILLQVRDTPPEALIAATIRKVYLLRKAERNWLVKVGRNLSILLKDDYDRLQYILSQVTL